MLIVFTLLIDKAIEWPIIHGKFTVNSHKSFPFEWFYQELFYYVCMVHPINRIVMLNRIHSPLLHQWQSGTWDKLNSWFTSWSPLEPLLSHWMESNINIQLAGKHWNIADKHWDNQVIKCDQICQKGSYTRTVSRHTFHRHMLATPMHQQHMCLLVEQSAFTQAFFSSLSGIHEWSDSL